MRAGVLILTSKCWKYSWEVVKMVFVQGHGSAPWLHVRITWRVLKHWFPESILRNSDLIVLWWGQVIYIIFRTSPGDLNVQEAMKNRCRIIGILSSSKQHSPSYEVPREKNKPSNPLPAAWAPNLTAALQWAGLELVKNAVAHTE